MHQNELWKINSGLSEMFAIHSSKLEWKWLAHLLILKFINANAHIDGFRRLVRPAVDPTIC